MTMETQDYTVFNMNANPRETKKVFSSARFTTGLRRSTELNKWLDVIARIARNLKITTVAKKL